MEMSMGHSHRQVQRQVQRQAQTFDWPEVIAQIDSYFTSSTATGEKQLAELLETIPQEKEGRLTYVIGGGWAVDLLTGRKREHTNINVLVLDPMKKALESARCLDYLGVQYMEQALKKALVKKDAVEAYWKQGKKFVYVPSHEFMIGTKLMPKDRYEKPREKDISDVIAMLGRHTPDRQMLAKVFDAMPYVRDGQTVAGIVAEAGKQARQRKASVKYALQAVSSELQEQLKAFEQKKEFLEICLRYDGFSGKELEQLHKYFIESGQGEFDKWLEERKENLVNKHNKVFHPQHPTGAFRTVELGEQVTDALAGIDDNELKKAILKDSMRHKKPAFYALQEQGKEGEQTLLWNPDGKLVYEGWSG